MDSMQALIADSSNDERAREELGELAESLVRQEDYAAAIEAFDALICFPEIASSTLNNALWAIQEDNTGRPSDPRRARRYLAAALLYARHNPPMHLNAAGVLMELGDQEAAMRQLLLARSRGVSPEAFLNEPLIAPLAAHPRWNELQGHPQDIDDVSWMEVALAAIEADELENVFPALYWVWDRTRSSRIADLIDVLCERVGRRLGYRAARIEDAIVNQPDSLHQELNSGSKTGRIPGGGLEGNRVWCVQDLEDPRFVTALVPILANPPTVPVTRIAEAGWRELCKNLVGLGDSRLIEPLETISHQIASQIPHAIGQTLAVEFGWVVSTLRVQQSKEAPLSAEEETCLEVLRAALGERQSPSPFHVVPFVVDTVPPLEIAKVEDQVSTLLALWRRTKSPQVADLLDLMEMRKPTSPDLASAIRAGVVRMYDDEDDDEIDANEAAQCVWAVKDAHDPRVTNSLREVLGDPPNLFQGWEDNGVDEFWREFAEVCTRTGDVRLIGSLLALSERAHALAAENDLEAATQIDGCGPEAMGTYVRAHLERTAEALEKVVVHPLSEEEKEYCAMLEASYSAEARVKERAQAVAKREKEQRLELLKAVAADLVSDEPRLAYAAFLEERGEPYGEFIRLQIQRSRGEAVDRDRERELQKAAGKTWLGDLAHLIWAPHYERGFVVACELKVHFCWDSIRPEQIENPLWATVRRITASVHQYGDSFRPWQTDSTIDLVGHENMRSLRDLNGVTPHGLIELVRRKERLYEQVTIDPTKIKYERWKALRDALGELPYLHTLRARAYQIDACQLLLADEVLQRKIRCLELHLGEDEGLDWPVLLSQIEATTLQSFALVLSRHAEQIVRLDRDSKGRFSEFSFTQVPKEPVDPVDQDEDVPEDAESYPLGYLLRVLASFPKEALRKFRLVQSDAVPARPLQHGLETLKVHLAKFPQLISIELPQASDSTSEVQELVTQLGADDEHLVLAALERLGDIRAAFPHDEIVRVLTEHASREVRAAACLALMPIADTSDLPVLLAALRRDRDRSAVRVLGCLHNQEAVQDIQDFLEASHDNQDISVALEALYRLQAVTSRLIKKFRGDPPDKWERVEMLGRANDPETTKQYLLELLEGNKWERAAAAEALTADGTCDDVVLLQRLLEDASDYTNLVLLTYLSLMPSEITKTQAEKVASMKSRLNSRMREQLAYGLLNIARRLRANLPESFPEDVMSRWQLVRDSVLRWAKEWRTNNLSQVDYYSPERAHWLSLFDELEAAWSSMTFNARA